jgi:hypothetical protein
VGVLLRCARGTSHKKKMLQCSSDEKDFISLIPQECGTLRLAVNYASILELDLLL